MNAQFLSCPECHAPDLFTRDSPPSTVDRGPRREHGSVTYPNGTIFVGCEGCGRSWTVPEFENLLGRRSVRIHRGTRGGA